MAVEHGPLILLTVNAAKAAKARDNGTSADDLCTDVSVDLAEPVKTYEAMSSMACPPRTIAHVHSSEGPSGSNSPTPTHLAMRRTMERTSTGRTSTGGLQKAVSMTKPKLLVPDHGRFFIERDVTIDVRFFRKCFFCLDIENKGEIDLRRFFDMLENFTRAAELGPSDSMLQTASSFDLDHSGGVSYDEFRQKFTEKSLHVRLNVFERIFMTFEDPSTSILARIIQITVLMIIVTSCACFIMESQAEYKVKPLSWPEFKDCGEHMDRVPGTRKGCFTSKPEPWPIFATIDVACISVFAVEYVCRLTTSHAVRYILWEDLNDLLDLVCSQGVTLPPPPSKLKRTWKFVVHPMNIVDFTAVFFGVLDMVDLGNRLPSLSVLRILRLTRIFRLFKRSKYSEVLNLVVKVMRESLEPLYILVFYLALATIIFSAMIYHFEKGVFEGPSIEYPQGIYVRPVIPKENNLETGEQLNVVSPFTSITVTFWWCIVTLTSIGYGDMAPITTAGRILAVFTMLSGIIVLAMPIGVIGSNFTTELRSFKEDQRAQHDARVREWLQIQDELEADREGSAAVHLLAAADSGAVDSEDVTAAVKSPAVEVAREASLAETETTSGTPVAAGHPADAALSAQTGADGPLADREMDGSRGSWVFEKERLENNHASRLREILKKVQQIPQQIWCGSPANSLAFASSPVKPKNLMLSRAATMPSVGSADHGAGPSVPVTLEALRGRRNSASSDGAPLLGLDDGTTTTGAFGGSFSYGGSGGIAANSPVGPAGTFGGGFGGHASTASSSTEGPSTHSHLMEAQKLVLRVLDEALELPPEKALAQINAMEAAALGTLYQAQPQLRQLLDAYSVHADSQRAGLSYSAFVPPDGGTCCRFVDTCSPVCPRSRSPAPR